MVKNFANTYLYTKYDEYEKQIFTFVMNATEIDKDTSEFDDIAYDVKRRQISSKLLKILKSNKVILVSGDKPLPKAFKVTCMKDIKGNGKDRKIFIDVSDIIYKDSSGKYVCRDVDILISYLVSAMSNMVYYIDEKRFINNSSLTKDGAACFSKLFTHVVDYVSKISAVPGSKGKCMYLTAMYYLANVLGKDINMEGTYTIAKRLSGISDREVDMINMQLNRDAFLNIKTFSEALSDILKISRLTLDVIVEKWMYLYGTGTVFALEHFPSFATMITDSYIGAYINNQKTIEKIIGREMVDFAKNIVEIGGSSV